MSLRSASGYTAWARTTAQERRDIRAAMPEPAPAICATCGVSGVTMTKRTHRHEVINRCAACAVARRKLPFPEKPASSIFNAPPSGVARMALHD